MGAWLLCVPQVIFSTSVMDLVEEAGNDRPPLIEEEEVHNDCTQPSMLLLALVGPSAKGSELFGVNERLTGALNGDVPHLPPWA